MGNSLTTVLTSRTFIRGRSERGCGVVWGMEFVEIPYPVVPETVGEPSMVYVFFFFLNRGQRRL